MPDEWNNTASGIEIHNSEDNVIYNNYLVRNGAFGANLGYNAHNNTIYHNYFLDNPGYFHQRVSQGFDEDGTNQWNLSTVGNYWSDYNGSGGYPMDSYGFELTGIDYYPTLLTISHTVSDPVFIYPTDGISLSGMETFQWSTTIDTLWHDVTYTFGYSENGTTLFDIESGITQTEFDVDTTSFDNGTYYFYVWALCSEWLDSDDAWVYPVNISNSPHSLSIPTVISPNGGETLLDTVTIQWTAATDSWPHTVTYSVAYSADGGITWINLITGYTPTSFDWDTTTVPDGSNYLIRVVAVCSTGLTIEDISDNTFTVENIIVIITEIPTITPTTTPTKTIPTTPTTTTTVPGETTPDVSTTQEVPTTTSKPSLGDFPGIMSILLFLSFFVVYNRKRKKT